MQCMTFRGFCCSGALLVVLHSHACISASSRRFLVYINDLLSSGEVADLYMPEDKDGNSKGSWAPTLDTQVTIEYDIIDSN